MAVIVPVGGPGDVDRRTGFSTVPPPSDEALAEHAAKRDDLIAERLKFHPSRLRIEAAENERRREAERRAACPDPRANLRQAHQLRGEAEGELRRVEELKNRAAALVGDLEIQAQHAAEALRAGTKAAGSKLVAALVAGAEALSLSPKTDATQSQVEAVAGRLSVAKEGLSQIEQQLEAAKRKLGLAERAVSAAIVALAIDHAAAEAAEIEAVDKDLFRRRRHLWSLSSAVHHMQRQIGEPGSLPAAVHRAIGSAADAPIDPAWNARLQRLRDDPEAELGVH